MSSFAQLSDASDGVSLRADLNVNLRNTINLITRDLLSAGRGIPVGGITVPSGTGSVPLRRPSPLDNLTFTTALTLPAVSHGNALGPASGDNPATPTVEGSPTDLVSVLMVDTTLALDAQPLASVAADGRSVTVNAATPIDSPSDGVRAGDLIMFTNSRGNALMMATGRVGQRIDFAANDPMGLNQVPSPSATTPNGTIMALRVSGAFPPTTATRVQMISYYVDMTNPARPTLMRRVNMFAPRAIGTGFEDFQMSYNLSDGVTQFQDAPTNANQIRMANVALLGRSFRPWRRNREFLRATVTSRVSLRSLSFVDRYR
jgi:hypothetical protein